ncbi:hypothetical protein OG533_02895 [Streptomyces sp. NBC_01186]|uniref:hypothetical protein n=1 Tax=unclassified Streptomyces TaxID=2593676 RepID=UPI002DDC3C12|nr:MULTISPECIES: hypothetical protein [unclassified Streptomyces]WSB80824.1 hypothetical protein OHB04_37365 [Streptomyces sp. NBC_01775]WSS10967.1 hypothetical protein OG533_02895 [Streptomyces sp. NBC_01186]
MRRGRQLAREVFLSPRGARTAAELAARYEGVQVCADNQEVVDPLFECVGGVLPVADEAAFNVFSALRGTLTTRY